MKPTDLLPKPVRRKLRQLLLNDPVLVSFPKSGRTWIRFMMRGLNIPLQFEHAGSKGTQPIDKSGYRKKRVILLIRDPRDTVVSYFHHCRTRTSTGYHGTISEFIRTPGSGIERIVAFNKAWLLSEGQPRDFTMMEYERLRSDVEPELRRLIAFASRRRVPDQHLREVIEKGSFDNLKKLEASGAVRRKYGKALTPGNPEDQNSFKVRKGKVGGYKDELPPEDIDFCNDVIESAGYWQAVEDCRQRLGF